MKRILAGLITLAALAGCGADGEPVRPALNANVSLSPSGVHTSTGVSLSSGPVTVAVAL